MVLINVAIIHTLYVLRKGVKYKLRFVKVKNKDFLLKLRFSSP